MRHINEIIVHCAATPQGKNFTVDDIRRWHKQRGWSDIGYHSVVYLDGSVHAGRPESQIGAHVRGRNRNTLGICYVGGVDANDPKKAKDTRTEAQKRALVDQINKWLDQYPDITKISGHHDYAAKACPSFPARQEYAYLLEERKGKKPTVKEKRESVRLLSMGDGPHNGRSWEVKALQTRMKELGYHSGNLDGMFGVNTRNAVMALQADAEIHVDGVVGPATRIAIDEAQPIDMGTRGVESIEDLNGSSRIMKNASAGKGMAKWIGAGLMGAEASNQAGLLDKAQSLVSHGEQVRGIAGSLQSLINFASDHWIWIGIVIAGVVFWRMSNIQQARLEDHRTGRTL